MFRPHGNHNPCLKIPEIGKRDIPLEHSCRFQDRAEDKVVVCPPDGYKIRGSFERQRPFGNDVEIGEAGIDLGAERCIRPPFAILDIKYCGEAVSIFSSESAGLETDVADRLRIEH
jgi:hypothetical protein